MKNRTKILALSMIAALCGIFPSQGAVSTANISAPSQDAFVSSDGVGQGSGLVTGQVSRINAGANRSYLVQFNTAPYNGQSLVKATFTLTLSSVSTSSGTPVTPPKLRVFRMLSSWTSGATWTSRGSGGGSWGAYGPCGAADTYTPVALLTPEASPANGTTYIFNVTSMVSDWLDGSATNCGIIVEWENSWSGAGPTDFNRQWIFNGAGATAGLKPKLDLTFAAGPTVNVKTAYGAAGDGITNDTAAFQSATSYLISQGGGTLYIPSGIYIVGEQTPVPNNTTQSSPLWPGGWFPYYVEKKIIQLDSTPVNGLLIKSDTNGSTYLKMKAGLRYGSFDHATGAALVTAPNAPRTNINEANTPGAFMNFLSAQNVLVKDIHLDGNAANVVLGGFWSTPGSWQIIQTGIRLVNCIDVTALRVEATNNCLDGVYNNYTVSDPSDPNPIPTPLTLQMCQLTYNGRCGLAWIGGNGVTAFNTGFDHQGKGAITSNPADGVDIEPNGTSNICRNGLFYRCTFIDNQSVGIDAEGNGSNSGHAEFEYCTAWGTTSYPVIAYSPGMRFVDCNLYGNTRASYINPDTALAPFFARCIMDDSSGLAYPVYANTALGVFTGVGKNITLDSCVINAHRLIALYFNGSVANGTTGMIMRNSTVNYYYQPTNFVQSYLYGVTLSNTRFQESLPAGAPNYRITINSTTGVGAGVVVDGPKVHWGTNTGPQGTIPPTP
ncbi:MAG: DNRLRE domain-containing protein [Chthoniobacterales bacterium]